MESLQPYVMGWLSPYVLGWLIPTVLAAIAGYLGGRVRKMTARDKAIEEGLMSVLLMELTEAYRKYVVEERPMSLERKRALEQLSKAYFALNGNGVGKQMWEELAEIQPVLLAKKG